MRKVLLLTLLLLTYLLSACTGANYPIGTGNQGVYTPPPRQVYYDDDYYRRRDWRRNREERRRLERERERLERDRDRFEQERYEAATKRPIVRPTPMRPVKMRCPSGFSPSNRKCSNKERKRGCKDLRLSNGQGCVSR